MVSKNQIKLIKSLSQKKFRNKHRLFVVEGIKGIEEFLKSSFVLDSIYTVSEGLFNLGEEDITIIDEKDLNRISFLKNPQKALAVFKIPEIKKTEIKGLVPVLDGVRDPGNLGTIIRLCDWFGVETLFCSRDTVDCYNPKVVQASMGSLARVKVCYKDLPQFIIQNNHLGIFGAMLDGENIYSQKLPESAIVVMGNEANGISEEVEKLLTRKISIPQFGKNQDTESLNVATATSIIFSEFKRSTITGK